MHVINVGSFVAQCEELDRTDGAFNADGAISAWEKLAGACASLIFRDLMRAYQYVACCENSRFCENMPTHGGMGWDVSCCRHHCDHAYKSVLLFSSTVFKWIFIFIYIYMYIYIYVHVTVYMDPKQCF